MTLTVTNTAELSGEGRSNVILVVLEENTGILGYELALVIVLQLLLVISAAYLLANHVVKRICRIESIKKEKARKAKNIANALETTTQSIVPGTLSLTKKVSSFHEEKIARVQALENVVFVITDLQGSTAISATGEILSDSTQSSESLLPSVSLLT